MAGNYLIPKSTEEWAGLVYRQVLTVQATELHRARHTWFISAVRVASSQVVTITGTVQSVAGSYQIKVTSPSCFAGVTAEASKQYYVKDTILALFHELTTN